MLKLLVEQVEGVIADLTSGTINTANIELDIKPLALFSDERVYRLERGQRFAYISLQAHCQRLNATTGSDYIDGEFSVADALLRVRDPLESDIDAMLDVGLISEVRGDRFRVEYTTAQTTHECLQGRADRYAKAGETLSATNAAAKEAQVVKGSAAETRREKAADRQRRKRERDRDLAGVADATPADPIARLGEPKVESSENPRRHSKCANCGAPCRPEDGCTQCGQQYDDKGTPGMRCRCGEFLTFAAPNVKLTEICPNCRERTMVSADPPF